MGFLYFKLVHNGYYLESLKIREIFYINHKIWHSTQLMEFILFSNHINHCTYYPKVKCQIVLTCNIHIENCQNIYFTNLFVKFTAFN